MTTYVHLNAAPYSSLLGSSERQRFRCIGQRKRLLQKMMYRLEILPALTTARLVRAERSPFLVSLDTNFPFDSCVTRACELSKHHATVFQT